MKKVSFKNLYVCKECNRKIVGYTGKCPICGHKVEKIKDETVVTLRKRR